MKWLLQVLLALVLAHGWLWTGLLKDKNKINEEQRTYILIFLGLTLFGQQIYVNKPKPKDRSVVERQRAIVENALRSLIVQYRETMPKLGLQQPPDSVRANLSLPTRVWGLLWRLKIYYTSFQKGAYSPAELKLKWKKGVGAIGAAWETKDITLFDAKNATYGGPEQKLTGPEFEAIKSIGSVLAVPIIGRAGKVVGVLSLDSPDTLDTTRFDSEKVILLAESFANVLEPMCFYDGVS